MLSTDYKKLKVVIPPFMLSTNEKNLQVVVLMPPKLHSYFTRLLRGQQQICIVQSCNVYLKIIAERHNTVLSADKNLWCMPSSEYYSS